jgi:hypothetical protein
LEEAEVVEWGSDCGNERRRLQVVVRHLVAEVLLGLHHNFVLYLLDEGRLVVFCSQLQLLLALRQQFFADLLLFELSVSVHFCVL